MDVATQNQGQDNSGFWNAVSTAVTAGAAAYAVHESNQTINRNPVASSAVVLGGMLLIGVLLYTLVKK